MKKLEIKEIVQDGHVKQIKITKQTHRQLNFGKSGDGFLYKGFFLKSSSRPEVKHGHKEDNNVNGDIFYGLYVRGASRDKDDVILTVPSEDWLYDLRLAVRAYNRYFSNCNACIERHCNSCKK